VPAERLEAPAKGPAKVANGRTIAACWFGVHRRVSKPAAVTARTVAGVGKRRTYRREMPAIFIVHRDHAAGRPQIAGTLRP
jgi:hypothetical protein